MQKVCNYLCFLWEFGRDDLKEEKNMGNKENFHNKVILKGMFLKSFFFRK